MRRCGAATGAGERAGAGEAVRETGEGTESGAAAGTAEMLRVDSSKEEKPEAGGVKVNEPDIFPGFAGTKTTPRKVPAVPLVKSSLSNKGYRLLLKQLNTPR